MNIGEQVELEFKYYDGLQKFCTTCGNLRHIYEVCSRASMLTSSADALMHIGNNPYATEKECLEADSIQLLKLERVLNLIIKYPS